MNELIEWLRQTLDEREHRARDVLADMQAHGYEPIASYDLRSRDGDTTTTTRVVVYDPQQELREVEAKRRIVERYELAAKRLARLTDRAPAGTATERDLEQRAVEGIRANEARQAMKLAALPYSNRPGYRQEWSPGEIV